MALILLVVFLQIMFFIFLLRYIVFVEGALVGFVVAVYMSHDLGFHPAYGVTVAILIAIANLVLQSTKIGFALLATTFSLMYANFVYKILVEHFTPGDTTWGWFGAIVCFTVSMALHGATFINRRETLNT